MAIESVQPLNLFPDLLLVRVHTDAGLIGHGGTEAVQASDRHDAHEYESSVQDDASYGLWNGGISEWG